MPIVRAIFWDSFTFLHGFPSPQVNQKLNYDGKLNLQVAS